MLDFSNFTKKEPEKNNLLDFGGFTKSEPSTTLDFSMFGRDKVQPTVDPSTQLEQAQPEPKRTFTDPSQILEQQQPIITAQEDRKRVETPKFAGQPILGSVRPDIATELASGKTRSQIGIEKRLPETLPTLEQAQANVFQKDVVAEAKKNLPEIEARLAEATKRFTESVGDRSVEEFVDLVNKKDPSITPKMERDLRDFESLREAHGFVKTQTEPFKLGLSIRGEEDIKAETGADVSEILKQPLAQAGKITTKIVETVPSYGIFNQIANATPVGGFLQNAFGKVLGKKASEFAATQSLELLADAVIQGPGEITRGISEEKSLSQLGKDFALNRLLDMVINFSVGGSSEALKKLSNADVQTKQIVNQTLVNSDSSLKELETAVKNNDNDLLSLIRQKLDMDENTILKQPTRREVMLAEKSKIFDDFDKLLFDKLGKKNGLTPKEADEMRALFKEQTGIDLKSKIDDLNEKLTIDFELAQKRIKPTTQGVENIVATNPVQTPNTQNVRSFSQTALNSDATGTELKQMIESRPDLYTRLTNEEATQVAKQMVEDNFEGALDMVKSGEKLSGSFEPAIGKELVVKLQELGRVRESLEVIESLSKKATKAGQDIQMFSLWSKMQPEGMTRWAQRTLDEAGIKLDEATAKQIFDEMTYIQNASRGGLAGNILNTLPPNQAALISKSINDSSMQRIKDLNVAKVMQKVTDQIPVSTARKVSTFQALSHLLNAKTIGRNIYGNTTFAAMEQLSKLGAIPFDLAMSVKTGARTTALPKFTEPFRNAFREGRRSLDEILLGVNVKDKGKFELFRGETFKNPVLNTAEKGLSLGLKTPDEFYKGYLTADALSQQLRARGVDIKNLSLDEMIEKATKEELKQANDEALYATFQDNSLPAQFLTGTKDILNNIGVGKKVRGASGINTREFGLGDLTVKYTRVPGNILSRGIEYTPIGAMKALHNMAKGFKGGQREIALQLGRALTGTGGIALATWLANKGVIVSQDQNRSLDARALDRSEGLGNYKLNLGAIERLLDGKDPSLQKGDELFSYNWNQPIGTMFAVGATLNEQLDGKVNGIKPYELAGRTLEEMIDLPTLSIVKKMQYEGMSGDSNLLNVLSIPFTESLSGFVPGPVRQVTQAIDPVFRETRGEDPFESAALRLKSSIPGLSQDLEPRLSPTGEEQRRTEGIFPTFVSPSTITTFDPSPVSKDLKDLEDLTGESGQFPSRKAPNDITFNKQEFKLTPEEKTIYQRTFGQNYATALTNFFEDFKNSQGELSDQSGEELINVIKLVDRLEDMAKNIAKQQILEGRGIK